MAIIQTLSVTQLRTEEVLAYFQLVQTETQYLTDELSQSAVIKFKTALTAFDAALTEFDIVTSASLVRERDAKRDFACNGLFQAGRVLSTYHPDLDFRNTWAEAYKQMMKYGNPVTLPQTQESGVIHNLLQDLLAIDEDRRKDSGLQLWIEELSSQENLFLAAVQKRTAEEAKRVNGIVKQTRTETETAYRQLISLVNALSEVNGTDTYATFISHMNVLIDNQKTVLKTRATNAAKKSDNKDLAVE